MSQDDERSLWKQGAHTWDDFLAKPDIWTLPDKASRSSIVKVLNNSKKKLSTLDNQYFERKLPLGQTWRMFLEFEASCVYLDIETNGGYYGDAITVIGVYDGYRFRAFVKGKDLKDFPDYISQYNMIVSFFGKSFDMPLIKKRFPQCHFPQTHLDLYPILRKLGYKGGLKKIEKQLGVSRDTDTEGLTGRDAITLWRYAQLGRKDALDTLIKYNEEDVVNLKTLMHFAYDNLKQQTLGLELRQETRKRKITS